MNLVWFCLKTFWFVKKNWMRVSAFFIFSLFLSFFAEKNNEENETEKKIWSYPRLWFAKTWRSMLMYVCACAWVWVYALYVWVNKRMCVCERENEREREREREVSLNIFSQWKKQSGEKNRSTSRHKKRTKQNRALRGLSGPSRRRRRRRRRRRVVTL